MQKDNLIILAQIPANTHVLVCDIFISLRQCCSMSSMFLPPTKRSAANSPFPSSCKQLMREDPDWRGKTTGYRGKAAGQGDSGERRLGTGMC